MFKSKFLVCDDDKNIVEVLSNTGEEIKCGDKPMHELVLTPQMQHKKNMFLR